MRQENLPFIPESKQDVIDAFRRHKKKLGAEHEIPNSMTMLNIGPVGTPMTTARVKKAFDRAMGKPLQQCTEAFRGCVPASERHPTQIIVAGGTSRSQALRKALNDKCRHFKLKPPIFIEDRLMKLAGRYPFVPPLLVIAWYVALN